MKITNDTRYIILGLEHLKCDEPDNESTTDLNLITKRLLSMGYTIEANLGNIIIADKLNKTFTLSTADKMLPDGNNALVKDGNINLFLALCAENPEIFSDGQLYKHAKTGKIFLARDILNNLGVHVGITMRSIDDDDVHAINGDFFITNSASFNAYYVKLDFAEVICAYAYTHSLRKYFSDEEIMRGTLEQCVKHVRQNELLEKNYNIVALPLYTPVVFNISNTNSL